MAIFPTNIEDGVNSSEMLWILGFSVFYRLIKFQIYARSTMKVEILAQMVHFGKNGHFNTNFAKIRDRGNGGNIFMIFASTLFCSL